MNQKNLLIAAIAGFVLINAGAYFVVKAFKGAPAPASASASASAAAPAVASPSAEELQRRKHDEEEGRRRRAAGLAALEAADYEKALINLTEAKVLLGEQASVDELLKVTEDLRNRNRTPAGSPAGASPPAVGPGPTEASAAGGAAGAEKPVAVAPPPSAGAHRPTARVAPAPGPVAGPRPSGRPAGLAVASREGGAEARAAAEAPSSRSGLLLVTTTPRGILVQVDGTPVDLTPMRISLRTGSHRVVLVDGDRHLFEASVEVLEGQVTTVLRDVSAELGSARAEEPAPPPPAPAAPVATPGAPSAGGGEVAASPAPAAAALGGLDVASPGLYGEVWINDRPYGFAPVRAHQLAPGPARIEVRVNGAVKRRAEVEVVAGQVQQVKVR
jgi:PEGA domain